MGLLDQIVPFADGGGLLDFLKRNAAGQAMPSYGAPGDQAQYDAPSLLQAMAPQQAPQGVPAMPPQVVNAAPQAPAPQPQAAQPMAAPAVPQPSFLNRAADALASISRGGSMLGAIRGQFDDPQSKASVQANVTAQALVAKGVDPQTAIAAVQPGNTEMLKTLIDRHFSAPKPPTSLGNGYIYNPTTNKVERAYEPDDKFQHVTVKNPDGSESLQSFNPSTGEYKSGPPPVGVRPGVDPDLTGQARLDALKKADPNYARKIEAMVNGDIPLPTGVAALRPDAKRQIEDVLAVDGSTSASDFATRAATRKDYASGIASRVTKSINTTIGHFATLDKAVDDLKNYSTIPSVSNWIHDKYGSNFDPSYQKAKATFETNKEAAVKELDFALSGGHSSVSGSAELRDKFHRADSPEALHAAITEAMSLLQKRLESHTKAFNEGTKSQRDQQDFIYPENRAAYNKLLGSGDTSTGQAVPGVSSANPSPALQPGASTTINGVTIKRVN